MKTEQCYARQKAEAGGQKSEVRNDKDKNQRLKQKHKRPCQFRSRKGFNGQKKKLKLERAEIRD
ncbi:MAG: hypothetical protein NUV45_13770 [Tepidanaerobacteraceae bacterium]|nr:hypothetical protein [Tepidanaerobacteraceae bacterium]